MRRMTRLEGTPDAIRTPFDGTIFPFKGDRVTPFTEEGRRYMRVSSQANGEQLFRVTRVIGGRYREDYTGRQVATTAADSAPAGDPGDEPVLPVSYLLFAKTWRYKPYVIDNVPREFQTTVEVIFDQKGGGNPLSLLHLGSHSNKASAALKSEGAGAP